MAFKLYKTFIICIILCFISEVGFSQLGKSKKVDLPATYTFDYNYKLQMTTQSQKEAIIVDYFLKKDADYFGFKMSQMKSGQGDMFFVMDNTLKVNAMFMDMMGQKMVQTSTLDMKDIAKSSAEDTSDFKLKKIGTKTIMGYECQGFITDNADAEITFYIAENAPVSLNNMWEANAKNMPKGFNAEWLKNLENGLMMEMVYLDKKKSKNNMTMTCIALETTDFSIKTSDYKSGLFGR